MCLVAENLDSDSQISSERSPVGDDGEIVRNRSSTCLLGAPLFEKFRLSLGR